MYRTVVLFGTQACHLCEQAQLIVYRCPALQGWQLELVDIAESEELVQAYAERIPVLEHPDGRVLAWPFNDQDLLHWLAQ